MPVEREGSVDEDLLEDSTNRIEEFLRAQGYRDAAAPHTREEWTASWSITFNVTRDRSFASRAWRSPATRAAAVEFESALRLREGMPFSAAGLDADVADDRGRLPARGFVGAKADSVVEPQPPRRRRRVPVVVRIIVSEGVQTLVGTVTFAGNKAVDETALRGLVRLKTGRRSCPRSLPPIATRSSCAT